MDHPEMTNMEITPENAAWPERVGAMRRAVLQLDPEQREEGARLLRRSDALNTAYLLVLEAEIPDEVFRRETLEVLAQVRDEARAEFQRYRASVGVPDLALPGDGEAR